MAFTRFLRLHYLIAVTLAKKYTRSLLFGFFAGLCISYFFWKVYPVAIAPLFHRVERIGIVGEFTPSALPISVSELISGGLTELSDNGSPKPSLAASWEATNSGKTFVFTIKKGLHWHNGKEVTAHDVNYNIRGVTFIPTGNDTLMAYLQYPYSPFPSLVSKPILLSGLTGFGPYQVTAISLNGGAIKSLQLTPTVSENTTQKEYSFYQTEAQAVLAFQLGEINEVADVSTPSGLSKWGHVTVTKNTKYNRIVTLFFNMKDHILSEKPVRQGLAYAVPELPYERALSPISKTSWAYTPTVRSYSFDPVQAKKLLSNSALATSSATLTLSTFSQYLDVAQSIAASWTALGIKTDVRVENEVPPTYQVLLSAQEVPPDPDQYLFWHSTQGQTNVTGYVNVKIDKLLEDGRQELNPEKRKTIYADFQRRLVEDAPAVFLYYPVTYTITRR